MILVDSSVWIDYFNGQATPQVDLLDQLLAIGDLILVEVLQGFRHDADYITAKQLLISLTVFNLLNASLATQSADHYRTLRKRGITIRKTVDVMIATSCIVENHTLMFSDKGFMPFVQHLGLNAVL